MAFNLRINARSLISCTGASIEVPLGLAAEATLRTAAMPGAALRAERGLDAAKEEELGDRASLCTGASISGTEASIEMPFELEAEAPLRTAAMPGAALRPESGSDATEEDDLGDRARLRMAFLLLSSTSCLRRALCNNALSISFLLLSSTSILGAAHAP